MFENLCLVGPLKFRDNVEINFKKPWRYISTNETGMDSYTGQYGKYDGDGYIADLAQYDRTNERFTKDLNELEKYHWLDKATRALFIDIITYNPSMNLFSYLKFVFEMPFTGGIFSSHKFENRQLFRVIDSFFDVLNEFSFVVCRYKEICFNRL